MRRRYLRASERDRQLALISGATDYHGFAHRDVVIEAVFEDLALKQRMVGEIEQCCGPQTIFASNTSSLPIGGSPLRPHGLRMVCTFQPGRKMPLVEVIPHATTDEQTIATVVKLAKLQGKRRSWLPTVPVLC